MAERRVPSAEREVLLDEGDAYRSAEAFYERRHRSRAKAGAAATTSGLPGTAKVRGARAKVRSLRDLRQTLDRS
ncbi:MAG: hypothetical protein JO168_13815 [Solirubrobacterales bacterium]|nr:hypothetical protein [Solirubrobacterales bacterium]